MNIPTILRLLRAARILRRNYNGGGGRWDGRRMMSTTVEPSRVSPWLMLPPASEDDGGESYKFYSLGLEKVVSFKKEAPAAEGLVKVVGSSYGWLASFNLDNQHIFLSNPITGRHINLPDIHSLTQSLFRPRCRTIVKKIILTSSPATDDDCRAVMSFGVRRMALCRPAAAEWTPLGDGFYEDLVYSRRRKRLFVITSDDVVESWDLTDPPTMDWQLDLNRVLDSAEPTKSEEETDRGPTDASFRSPRSLVFAEQSDKLYLVIRYVWEGIGGGDGGSIYLGPDRGFDDSYPYKTFAFDVHEIDWKQGRRVRYVEGCLGGLAVFVGNNHAVALSAADFPELKPNSIYFTDDEEFTPLNDHILNYGGHDIGIFNYVDRKISSAYYSCHASHITWILPEPKWFTPTLT